MLVTSVSNILTVHSVYHVCFFVTEMTVWIKIAIVFDLQGREYQSKVDVSKG